MAFRAQLDAAGGPPKTRVKLFLFAFLLLAWPAWSQTQTSDQTRLAAARAAFDAGNWQEAVDLARGPSDQSPDLDFLAGLALARLQEWNESRQAFLSGLRKAPRDPRFFVELAGVAYKQDDDRAAKRNLRAALRLNPQDAYSREFLATIFFLEGNLEAALKYWNPEDKPRLRSVAISPSLKLSDSLRNRTLAFNAPQVLTEAALLTTRSRLENLGLFSSQRINLTPAVSGDYDLALRLAERNGWGNSKLEGLVSLLSGLPYQTVYPEFYNLGGKAINFTSLARWDDQKRRVSLALSTPLEGDPSLCLRFFADARNENWNLSQTFSGSGAPLSDLNMRTVTAGADLHAVVDGLWSWAAGAEFAHRNFQNVSASIALSARPFFTNSGSLAVWFGVGRSLLRLPEHRFTLDSSAEVRAGREFAAGLGPFARLRGSLQADWFPQAKGDDYKMRLQLRAGATVGPATLDELFQLGIERDNDLWLRGEAGTLDGRKGAAPLGRRYFLENWELDKNLYQNGLFTLKLGPFFDGGAIADSSGLFGSRRWLWDSGLQCKVRVLGGVTVLLSYGFDLRGGKGVLYGTVQR